MRLPMIAFAAGLLAAVPALAATDPRAAATTPDYGPDLERFDYPHPVKRHGFTAQGQALEMAYMDVAPTGTANGRTAILLHGKNFCGATWEGTIQALSGAGYRVLVPDQIGFCKSSKPAAYAYSFQQLAANTRALARAAGVEKAVVVGHSMGGMLATRFALTFPEFVEQLVLVNPIGLEDWKAAGIPWRSVDDWYRSELKSNADSIRAYQRKTYYAGSWEPRYERWVQMLAGMSVGAGRERVAWNQALTADMVFNQPVVYELERLAVPTLLLIGMQDNTAIGKDAAPPAVQARVGNYPVLARQAADRIPGAVLMAFDDLGHSPQIQAPDRFHAALLRGLEMAGQTRPDTAANPAD